MLLHLRSLAQSVEVQPKTTERLQAWEPRDPNGYQGHLYSPHALGQALHFSGSPYRTHERAESVLLIIKTDLNVIFVTNYKSTFSRLGKHQQEAKFSHGIHSD